MPWLVNAKKLRLGGIWFTANYNTQLKWTSVIIRMEGYTPLSIIVFIEMKQGKLNMIPVNLL